MGETFDAWQLGDLFPEPLDKTAKNQIRLVEEYHYRRLFKAKNESGRNKIQNQEFMDGEKYRYDRKKYFRNNSASRCTNA